MSGVVQSEYCCSYNSWPLVIAAARAAFIVEQEHADHLGRICFMQLKQTLGDKAGVVLDVLPPRGAHASRGDLVVAMHWLLKSPGADESVSRRLAERMDEILKLNGAKLME